MRKILEELWHGNIAAQTKSFNRNIHYEDALKMMYKNQEKLKSILEDKEKDLFEKFCDCRDEVEQYTEEDTFVIGFRLGARIIIESFYENDAFFSEASV